MCRVMRTWRTEFVMVLLAGCMLVAAARTAAQEIPDFCNLIGIGIFQMNNKTNECEFKLLGDGCLYCYTEIVVTP